MGMTGNGRVTAETATLVWTAEDGRCEGCTRPMDRRVACFTRMDHSRADWSADNLQLVCIDCNSRRPDLLATATLGGDVAQRLSGHLPPDQAAAASRWLLTQLRRYGVLVWAKKTHRVYWLPGIGTFRVEPRPDGPAEVVAVEKLVPQPALRVQPQARSRGLPKPDRRPLTAASR